MITNDLHLLSVPRGLDTEQLVSTYQDGWRTMYVTRGKILESVTIGSDEWQIIEFDHSVWFGQSGTTIFNLPYQLWHAPTTDLPTSGTHPNGLIECIKLWARIVKGREIAQGLGESFSVRARYLTPEEYAREVITPNRKWTGLDLVEKVVDKGYTVKEVKLDPPYMWDGGDEKEKGK